VTEPRILLLGHTGQLGWELHRCLLPLGEVHAVDFPEIDLSQPETVRPLVRGVRPDLIVNAAAYTAVDRAETEPELARLVNAVAPRVIAEEAAQVHAALIHYSTDYVFDGQATRPYRETDVPAPINVYGRTKLEGEQAIQAVGGSYLILRTSWVYSFRRRSFPVQVLEWARTQRVVRVVSDQIGSPTWCRMLAQVTALALAPGMRDLRHWLRKRAGVYHLAGSGLASRLEWASAVLEFDPHPEEQLAARLDEAVTSDFPGLARRPSFSALDCNRFRKGFGAELPEWRESLQLAIPWWGIQEQRTLWPPPHLMGLGRVPGPGMIGR
jgi:dTDP-4-dehydrorhamnose reductase